jgi:hypothetical protein
MKIELMDQPILIVKSSTPTPASLDSRQDTLKEIENLLQEEIHELRDRIDSEGEEIILSDYFTDFNLHFQTDQEVVSIILESEWQEQIEGESALDENSPDSLLDLNVSKLMRVVKVSYSENENADENKEIRLKEKKLIHQWIIDQEEEIPFLSGLGKDDYLLLCASSIISSISRLKKHVDLLD